ncbi:Protein PLANT CADMIUM RESISTANCE 8 [Diplonema papillatum]|nr:Protein PLANT CADMIUM RESISTANCE 8 [Diplonema papillatum]
MEFLKYDMKLITWNTPLTGVFYDLEVCFQGTLCPFYVAARNKAMVEGRRPSFLDLVCCPSEYYTRQQVRSKLNLGRSECTDLLSVLFCWQCVLCQHGREFKVARRTAYTPPTLEMTT